MSVSKLGETRATQRGRASRHEEMRRAAVPTVVVMLLHIITNLPVARARESLAREATPENWKELPEREKREFLRRNYGPLATTDEVSSVTSPPPSHDESPVLLPAAATGRRRAPFPVAREPTPENWKDWPEQNKRAYLVRNYGADSVRTDV